MINFYLFRNYLIYFVFDDIYGSLGFEPVVAPMKVTLKLTLGHSAILTPLTMYRIQYQAMVSWLCKKTLDHKFMRLNPCTGY